MKKLIDVLLVASVGVSVLLVGLLLAGYRSSPETPPPPAPTPPSASAAKTAYDGETWNTLHADDLATMVQRLREQGFPPEMVRAILAAQLRDSYAARMRALDPDVENRPFWKSYSIDPKVQREQMKLHREQQKIVRDLLGPDGDPQETYNALYRGVRFDPVPPEKLADVKQILREYDDARNDLFSSAGGVFGPEIQRRADELLKEQQVALSGVLTAQELEEWNIRNSDTARSVRNQLSTFNPTEEEFRMVYKLQAEFDERFPRMYSPTNPDEMQRRAQAQHQLNEQIKAALGPVRAPEFERARDFMYRQTSQLVSRLELPPESANQVHEVQRDIREKMTAAMRSRPSPAERTRQFEELARETETRVTAILGARGFEAYKENGGQWMQSLRPPSAATVPAR